MKILLLDTDGVVIPKEKYFSTRYAEEKGIPVQALLPFFQGQFRRCQAGQCDMKEELAKYIADWQWTGSVDEFLAYWFASEPDPSTLMLEAVADLRKAGVKCYIATDQERYRAQYLWHTVGLSEHFDGAFFSCDLEANKASLEFWEKTLALLGNPNPDNVTYFDDEEESVKAAASLGIDARLFTDIDAVKGIV